MEIEKAVSAKKEVESEKRASSLETSIELHTYCSYTLRAWKIYKFAIDFIVINS